MGVVSCFSQARLLLLLLSLGHLSARHHSTRETPQVKSASYDVLVYGATPAGIAAAIAAATYNATVALLETSAYVGGMAGPGGIGLRDISDTASVVNQSIIKAWLGLNSKYYGVDGPVWQPDQAVGQANWETLLQSYPGVQVFVSTGLAEIPNAVEKDGTVIKSITTVSTSAEGNVNMTVWSASQYIDASYEADIVRAANISYTYGRESREQYNESLAGVLASDSFSQFSYPVNPYWPDGSLLFGVDAGPLPPPGSADTRVMPYSYRLCVTNDPGNLTPWYPPQNYNVSDFEILVRYAQSLTAKYGVGGPPVSALVSQLNYNGYPTSSTRSMRYDLCESGNSAVSTDEPTAIYDAYITGNRSVRASVAAAVKYWVAGMMYTLANAAAVPEGTRNSTKEWGLCADAWPENANWPELLYVREGVRIIGDVVSTQNSLVRGACSNDSIGVGDWTIDVHIMNRVVGTINGKTSAVNEGEIGFAPLPGSGPVYELPYSLLLPKESEATNLLVPNSPSASHIAFASIRVEPTFTQLGTAAGCAAVLAMTLGATVQAVPPSLIMKRLSGDFGQCIHPNCTRTCP